MIPTEELKEKLFAAYFTDDMYGTVEVLYKSENDGALVSFMFDYSRDELMRQSLEQAGVDEETLVNNTVKYRKTVSAIKTNKVMDAAKQLSNNVTKKEKATNVEIYDTLLEKNLDTYELFKAKVWVLKHPETKNTSIPNLREKVSKAKTVLECLSLYNEVLKEGKEKDGDI